MIFQRWLRATAVGMGCCVLLSLCGFTAQCEDISDRVLRLHILAASDSDEDQALKLKVRDAILEQTGGLLDDISDMVVAKETLEQTVPQIEAIARDVLRENGVSDKVKAEVCEMYFRTRVYEHITLPAGHYEALRVTIGEGTGQNWWCVVYPPMCLSSACETRLDTVLSESQNDIVSAAAQYEVRFKVVEWYQQLCDWIR